MLHIRAGQVAYHPNPIPARRVADTLPRLCVYLPPRPANRVLYLLHGVGDIESSWEMQGAASALIEQMQAAGAIDAPMVVMPFGFVTEANKLQRRFPDVEAFDAYLLDIIQRIEPLYESREALLGGARDRAIAGLSMGGKQALEFGFAHADLFTAIGSFSGAVQDRGDGAAVGRILQSATTGRAASVRPRVYCSCGTEDGVGGLVAANRELAAGLTAAGLASVFQWMPGEHEWAVWRRSLEEFLRFWSKPGSSRRDGPRRFERLDPMAAGAALDVAAAFAQRGLWPYVLQHSALMHVAPHYHVTDEELQITAGSMTFVDVRNGPQEGITLRTGERLRIPEGTVHEARIGPEGVEYVMGLTRAVQLDDFPVFLPAGGEVRLAELVELVEANYAAAELENTGATAETFFRDFLSQRFVFVGARDDGALNKDVFVSGLESRKAGGRSTRGLRLRREGTTVAATAMVTMSDGREFVNSRLFEREEGGRWRCVRWVNVRRPS